MKRGDPITRETPITPDTKIGALLDARPELEAVLVALSPRFEKLRNPLLRRTVAKVATLAQAARIGDVPTPKLVATLRAAAGQEVAPESGAAGPPSDAAAGDAGARPDWVSDAAVTETVDADAMLAGGVHPLGLVREKAAALAAGQLLRLDAGFRPAPLLDTLAAAGHPVWCETRPDGRFATFVAARRDAETDGAPADR